MQAMVMIVASNTEAPTATPMVKPAGPITEPVLFEGTLLGVGGALLVLSSDEDNSKRLFVLGCCEETVCRFVLKKGVVADVGWRLLVPRTQAISSVYDL